VTGVVDGALAHGREAADHLRVVMRNHVELGDAPADVVRAAERPCTALGWRTQAVACAMVDGASGAVTIAGCGAVAAAVVCGHPPVSLHAVAVGDRAIRVPLPDQAHLFIVTPCDPTAVPLFHGAALAAARHDAAGACMALLADPLLGSAALAVTTVTLGIPDTQSPGTPGTDTQSPGTPGTDTQSPGTTTS
jgi:hypothetical protein